MSWYPMWDKRQKDSHDKRLSDAVTVGGGAIDLVKDLYKNYEKIIAYSLKVAESVSGEKVPVPEPDPRLHMLMEQVHQLGQAIRVKSGRNMTQRELDTHHRYLKAVLPLIKENQSLAAGLALHWRKMHDSLQAIAEMYEKRNKAKR